MTKFESMDFVDPEGVEGLEGKHGREDKAKKTKRTLDSETVSPEYIFGDHSRIDNLNPEEIYILKEEGKLAGVDLEPVKKKKASSIAEFELDSDDENPNFENNEPNNDEASLAETTKEVEEVISSSREEALSKERAAVISNKKDDHHDYPMRSYGRRGKELKGKFKKGLESIKRLLKIE